MLALEEEKAKLLNFIESRMNKIAPNVCVIIGSRIAAQLIGLSGGLVALRFLQCVFLNMRLFCA